MGTWIAIAVAVVLIILVISIYNRLVALKNRFKNAFAQIDVQLQRRYDLIPNLVETAKGYLTHERETLTQVIEARNQAAAAKKAAAEHPDNPKAIAALGAAESALGGSLANFFALSENYPELRANETISELMEELSTTENRIGFARQAFNDAVMNYNTYREQFPNNLVSGIGSFQHAELLEIDSPEARKAVKVQF
ncbi:MAG: LemA family protein [Alcanivoracaceae bacterium]|jgi:LemA protein|nr:LemA family protein [Alcanivoracaceae bacterium]